MGFFFFRFYNTIIDLKISILSTVFLYLKMVLWEAYNNISVLRDLITRRCTVPLHPSMPASYVLK